jgi:DNA-binding SARP family transcriptional activator/tetratricopeptide (TPR) repeat protein
MGSAKVAGAQPALVVAFLVLERPRSLLRDELVELLWPGELPDHWEGAARKVVSRARRALVAAGLPAAALSSTDGVTTLDIPAEVTVDVERAFAACRRAEDLVAGSAWLEAAAAAETALTDLVPPFVSGSECRWAIEWRTRIDGITRRALHAAVAAALGVGHTADAVDLAHRAVALDAFDERSTRLLMVANEQSGHRAAALSAYEDLRRRLDDELGVRPTDETEEAYRELLGAPPEPPRVPSGRRRGGVPPVDAGLFVGRDGERALLASEWATVQHQERAHVVVVEGEAGVGKTRLVAEEARALDPAPVLWARCDPDMGAAHGPFADLVTQLLALRPDVTHRIGSIASHLAPIVPQLAPAVDAAPDSPDQASARLFRAVGATLAVGAEAPLLLVIDDLHWADDDTLALLRHVLPRLADRPCLVVLLLRDPPPAVSGALAELARLAPTETVKLRGLSIAAVSALLEASRLELVAEVDAVATTVAERTAGNALYVTQLVREAQSSSQPFDPTMVPDAVARLLERRVGALDAQLAATLALAAIVGTRVDLATMEACATAPPDTLLDHLEDLCHRRFLEERGVGKFAFAHELVRDAVLATVGPTRRGQLHRRVGDALAATGADAGLVAQHYVGGGRACREEAVTWSLAAGDSALDSAAWSAARDHFGMAAELAVAPEERCRAWIGLGRAWRALGDLVTARSALDDALASARAHGLAHAAAAATLALVGGGGRGVALELPDAERAELLRRALDALPVDAAALRVPMLAELALALVLTDAHEERRELAEECLATARAHGEAGGLATALFARRTVLMGPTGTPVRAADAREALALPRRLVSPEVVMEVQLGLVEDLLELGERGEADRALTRAVELAAELDHPYWSWATACWQTLVAIVDGEVDRAEQLAFAALEHQGEHPEAVAALGVNLVCVRLFQERAGEMVGLLEAAVDANPRIPAYRAVLALCCCEAGDVDAAARAYEWFAATGFELPADSNWLLAVAVLADACATLGDAEGASVLAARLEPFERRQVILNCYGGGGAWWGPVAHHLGRLAAVRGAPDDARGLLEDAVELSERFGAPIFAARSRSALAALT